MEASTRKSRQSYQPAKPGILNEIPQSLAVKLSEAGFQAFRTKQIFDWIYRNPVDTFQQMSNLPANLRDWLDDHFTLRETQPVLQKKSGDHTTKILSQLGDGSLIETVLIQAPMTGVGQETSRMTVCVSSQVGCAYGCKFCASGLAGWKRDLSAGEILSQFFEVGRVVAGKPETVRRQDHVPFDNIVFMGMGEPLANFDALAGAITALHEDWGFRFGARRITVSTSGLVPEIFRLADLGIPVRLAISLHGATDTVRNQIMPINRRYPLEKLIPAARYFREKHRRMLTLEFILIEGINDSLEQAAALAEIATDLHAHVNCIPYNKVEGLPWKRPGIMRQEKFAGVLREAGVSVTIRREKGHDIAAACGQLRLQKEPGIVLK